MRPKNFNNKGKQKITATTQHDLESYLGDETKVKSMGLKGKESIASTSPSNSLNETQNEKERMELFHIRVISKHKKLILYLIVAYKQISFMKALSKS